MLGFFLMACFITWLFQRLALPKRGFVKRTFLVKMSLHENKNTFSYEWLCTKIRFETEVLGNSEVPYSLRNFKLVW